LQTAEGKSAVGKRDSSQKVEPPEARRRVNSTGLTILGLLSEIWKNGGDQVFGICIFFGYDACSKIVYI
jgi:hypothetical protein